ncbi:MAG: nucleotidyltransferase family protein [Eubacteriales bacterium]
MGNVAAVICEYNPFHLGHKYQIDKIKEDMDISAVIAVMSGEVTQRGEFAITDKYVRAEAAVRSGVDAVFELPYPYCASCAEIFAKAGVAIASALGANRLYFGTESGNTEYIEKIADAVDSAEFNEKASLLAKDFGGSYLDAKEKALSDMGLDIPKTPNDILATEYVRAIKNGGYNMEYRTIKRTGAGYKDESVSDIMSASAIRKHFYESGDFLSVPTGAKAIYEKAKKEGMILDPKEAENFLFRYILSLSAEKIEKFFDAGDGIGYFICSTAKESKNAEEFFRSLTSKSYTYARLKRVVMYSLFGIENIAPIPSYTVLLASNAKGREICKNAKIPIITKFADAKKLDPVSEKALKKSLRTDEIYMSLLNNPKPSSYAYKRAPFIL